MSPHSWDIVLWHLMIWSRLLSALSNPDSHREKQGPSGLHVNASKMYTHAVDKFKPHWSIWRLSPAVMTGWLKVSFIAKWWGRALLQCVPSVWDAGPALQQRSADIWFLLAVPRGRPAGAVHSLPDCVEWRPRRSYYNWAIIISPFADQVLLDLSYRSNETWRKRNGSTYLIRITWIIVFYWLCQYIVCNASRSEMLD